MLLAKRLRLLSRQRCEFLHIGVCYLRHCPQSNYAQVTKAPFLHSPRLYVETRGRQEGTKGLLFYVLYKTQFATAWRTACSHCCISSCARDLGMVGRKRRSARHCALSSLVPL